MLLWVLTMLSQVSAAQGAAPERQAPRVTVPRIDAQISVDGTLDEPAWRDAASLVGFSQYEPVDGRPAEERTEVRVWYAPDAIHFGILAYDRDAGSIRATRADRDRIDGEDHVIIYLDTFNDRRRAFFFGVNALGVQQDGIRSEGAVSAGRIFGGNIDTNPDFLFDSGGRITEEGYVVEVRIPFKSLRYPGNGPQTWGLNVVRKVQRTGYTDTWTAVRRANASFLVQAGTMDGLHDLERGVVVEAQPFVTAAADGARRSTGGFARGSIEPEIGLNLQLGFTNLSLDATANPDFSQVESDVGQVTVNERFALFTPEKRPFFLDGIDLFSTPNQLVYTRRIANPIAGGKVAGKLGPIGVAHITAIDESPLGPDALFNVTRLRRDFGSSSLVGVTFTDRSELGDAADRYNRVVAGDLRLVFARLYFFEAQLGHAWNGARAFDSAGNPLGRTAAHGPLWNLTLDRTGRSFGFNYGISGVGEQFEAAAGYVPRSDIVDAHIFNRVSLYGARGAFLETVTAFFGPTRIWRHRDFGEAAALEGGENVNLMARMRGGWQANAQIGRDFVRLDPALYSALETPSPAGLRPYTPLEKVAGYSIAVTGTTPTYQSFDATATVRRGRVAIFAEGAEGTGTQLSGGVSLRPNESLRVGATGTFQRITRTRDTSEFARTLLPRLEVEYQPARSLFFRAIGEYRSERRAALEDARTGDALIGPVATTGAQDSNDLRVDFLASFEPSPGTVAFFGYGSSLVSQDAFGFSDLSRSSDGFFLKLAYQFRR